MSQAQGTVGHHLDVLVGREPPPQSEPEEPAPDPYEGLTDQERRMIRFHELLAARTGEFDTAPEAKVKPRSKRKPPKPIKRKVRAAAAKPAPAPKPKEIPATAGAAPQGKVSQAAARDNRDTDTDQSDAETVYTASEASGDEYPGELTDGRASEGVPPSDDGWDSETDQSDAETVYTASEASDDEYPGELTDGQASEGVPPGDDGWDSDTDQSDAETVYTASEASDDEYPGERHPPEAETPQDIARRIAEDFASGFEDLEDIADDFRKMRDVALSFSPQRLKQQIVDGLHRLDPSDFPQSVGLPILTDLAEGFIPRPETMFAIPMRRAGQEFWARFLPDLSDMRRGRVIAEGSEQTEEVEFCPIRQQWTTPSQRLALTAMLGSMVRESLEAVMTPDGSDAVAPNGVALVDMMVRDIETTVIRFFRGEIGHADLLRELRQRQNRIAANAASHLPPDDDETRALYREWQINSAMSAVSLASLIALEYGGGK